MVVTQLQLKWTNHSTQLLTGLKYLFKNEQFVDCTLKCNKQTLKVHRSVLAACSPYFERELENNPLIIIKDMQFNVLQALIEFMYYGETCITEENLTSLIEAAKLFEIKGLSEMDLLTSTENNAVPSAVVVSTNCSVGSSFVPQNIKDGILESDAQTMGSSLNSQIDEAISINMSNKSLLDCEDANSNLVMENANCQSHSSRNFVITPPQTESAQILLSLACSYSEKQYLSATASNDETTAIAEESCSEGACGRADDNRHHPNLERRLALFDESCLTIRDDPVSSSSSSIESARPPTLSSSRHQSAMVSDSFTASFVDTSNCSRLLAGGDNFTIQNSSKQNSASCVSNLDVAQQPSSVGHQKSLLAELLTCSNQNATQDGEQGCGVVGGGGIRYQHLYDVPESSSATRNGEGSRSAVKETVASPTAAVTTSLPLAVASSAAVSTMATAAASVDLSAGIILEYPFLIQTNDGYVDLPLENMLNVLENGDLFASHIKNTVKVIPKEEVISLTDAGVGPGSMKNSYRKDSGANAASTANSLTLLPPLQIDEQPSFSENDATVLERIQQDTEDELRDDPEAVVLTRVADDGRLETYVLSSTDVKALEQRMNEQRRKRRHLEEVSGSSIGASTGSPSAVTPSVTAQIDVESPMSSVSESAGESAATSLITRIVQFGTPVDKAISKLPFKKSGRPLSSLAADSSSSSCDNGFQTATGAVHASSNSSCSASASLLCEANLHHQQSQQQQNSHQLHHHHPHHENMFEELDSQYSMGDCSIEHMQREYVAYEEASKNETQLEHNYYANAMKDEDEECVVISAGENYDLRTMMLVQQPLTNGSGLSSDKALKPTTASYHHIIDTTSDVYLSNGAVRKSVDKKELPCGSGSSRRNGFLAANVASSATITTNSGSRSTGASGDTRLFNGKSDLILNKDALMSSAMEVAAAAATSSLVDGAGGGSRLANGAVHKNGGAALVASDATAVTIRAAKSRSGGRGGGGGGGGVNASAVAIESGVNLLPFKSVKNSGGGERKQSRKTHKRKATTDTMVGGDGSEKRKLESIGLNGDALVFADCSLVEEIIVDEIS